MNCVDRALVTISIMRRLEELSKRRIHELFDYVCGVSTGSLVGAMAAIYRVPLAEMEEIYKEFSVQMFERNRLIGAGKLFMSHAYYDTEVWERILRYAVLLYCHKVGVVSSDGVVHSWGACESFADCSVFISMMSAVFNVFGCAFAEKISATEVC